MCSSLLPDDRDDEQLTSWHDIDVTLRSILHRVHFMRIATQVQMIAFLNVLDDWLEHHSFVRRSMTRDLLHELRLTYIGQIGGD